MNAVHVNVARPGSNGASTRAIWLAYATPDQRKTRLDKNKIPYGVRRSALKDLDNASEALTLFSESGPIAGA